MLSRLAVCTFSLCAFAVSSRAQAPAFEVASVRPSTSREINGMHNYPGGRIECHGCTLENLLMHAFNVQAFQLSGLPSWADDDRYEIAAKPPKTAKLSQFIPRFQKAPLNPEQQQMLQSLLAERFDLRFHRDSREAPVYLLLKGKGEPKLTDSKDKAAYPWSGQPDTGQGLKGENESMPDLAWRLSRFLERPVLDRTGIAGSFDFLVPYASDESRPDVTSVILTTIPRLGLKLEPSRAPVETIVIEHAARPSANC